MDLSAFSDASVTTPVASAFAVGVPVDRAMPRVVGVGGEISNDVPMFPFRRPGPAGSDRSNVRDPFPAELFVEVDNHGRRVERGHRLEIDTEADDLDPAKGFDDATSLLERRGRH